MDERIIIDLVATCLEQGPVLNEKVVPRVEQLSKLLYERSSNGELLVTLASLIATVCFHVTTDMKGSSPATEYEALEVINRVARLLLGSGKRIPIEDPR